MHKHYRHLTQEQRSQIAALKAIGEPQKQIALVAKVSVATVCRELGRNSVNTQYDYEEAERRAVEQRKNAAQSQRKIPQPLMVRVVQHLKEDWSSQ